MKQNKYVIFYNAGWQSRFVMCTYPNILSLRTTLNPEHAMRVQNKTAALYWIEKLSDTFPMHTFLFVRLKDIGCPHGYTVNLGNSMWVRNIQDYETTYFQLTDDNIYAESFMLRWKAERKRDELANDFNEPSFRVRPYWYFPKYKVRGYFDCIVKSTSH